MEFIIKNDTVGFSELHENDLKINKTWMNDPELKRLIERKNEISSIDKQVEWLNRMNTDVSKRVFKIILIENKKYIGNVTLFGINKISHETEIGIFIASPEYRGRGYGTEAIRLAVKYIRSCIDPGMKIRIKMLRDNLAAFKTYKKIGFVECEKSEYNYTCDDNVERIYMVLLPEKKA